MYQINEYVMYKNDVCKVIDITHNINNKDYYVLVPISDLSLKINVPVDKQSNNLRKVFTKKEAQKIIKEIKDIEPVTNINDKNLEVTYQQLLNNRNYVDLIKIIKTSYLRNEARTTKKKKPSEKDSKYFELAERYLYNELGIALNMTFDEVKNKIIKTIEGD